MVRYKKIIVAKKFEASLFASDPISLCFTAAIKYLFKMILHYNFYFGPLLKKYFKHFWSVEVRIVSLGVVCDEIRST